MNPGTAFELGQQALWQAAVLVAPLLAAIGLVGLAVGILQTATQVQESTLSFIPKVIALGAMLLWLGPWMIEQLVAYTLQTISSIPG